MHIYILTYIPQIHEVMSAEVVNITEIGRIELMFQSRLNICYIILLDIIEENAKSIEENAKHFRNN